MDSAKLGTMSREELVAEVLRERLEKAVLQSENTVLQSGKAKAESRRAELEFELEQLKRMIFGAKSERFTAAPSDPNQLELDLGLAVGIAWEEARKEESKPVKAKRPDAKKPVRQAIPDKFPRNVIVIKPEEDITGMDHIGDEVTEELEYTPGTLVVNQYRRPKYAAKAADGTTRIVCAPLHSRPIEKGIPGPGLLAKVIIDKYTDHLPLHRQSQRFAREGVDIPLSTMADWIAKCCLLLEPLYDKLRQMILASGYVQADETPIKVLDSDKKGAAHQGYHWTYQSPGEGLVLFDYRPGRSRSGPAYILRNYKGWLQTDGYSAYDDFEKREGIFLVGCLAHVRRYFEKALDYDKPNAGWVLGRIRELYAVERQARENGLGHEARKALRGEMALPVINELGTWLRDNYKVFLPKSPMGEAVNYFLGRFNYVARYLQDGQLEIDNNLAENAIRPIAIGRKNYMFAGSHEGARRAAMLYSFLGTCKRNGIEPFTWLRGTLTKIQDHPVNRIGELLPVRKA
jgi:transposase